MTSREKFYVETIALSARERCIEANIISRDTRNMSVNQLEKIVNLFSGSLKPSEDRTYLEKISDDSFVIHYNNADDYLSILHELGHVFFDFSQMSIGEVRNHDGIDKSDTWASLFSRSYAMPREIFESDVISNISYGKCDINSVASKYKINYFDIMSRGEDLNIWE